MERLILLAPLLFKLVTTPDRETVLLAVPDICIDKIIMLYHTSLFAGHQGVIKTYLTISEKFFIPDIRNIPKMVSHLSVSEERQTIYEAHAN